MTDDQNSEIQPQEAAASDQRRRLVMQFDESGHAPHYANAYQVQAGRLEVVLDFGYRTAAGRVNVPGQDGSSEQADRLRFIISNRVALPYPVAKQLLKTLAGVVADAEKKMAEASSKNTEAQSQITDIDG